MADIAHVVSAARLHASCHGTHLAYFGVRAQVADIADVVRQRADALMLSGESAAGAYPEKAVGVLRAVATRIEEWCRWGPCFTASALPNPGPATLLAQVVMHSVVTVRSRRASRSGDGERGALSTQLPCQTLALQPCLHDLLWTVLPRRDSMNCTEVNVWAHADPGTHQSSTHGQTVLQAGRAACVCAPQTPCTAHFCLNR